MGWPGMAISCRRMRKIWDPAVKGTRSLGWQMSGRMLVPKSWAKLAQISPISRVDNITCYNYNSWGFINQQTKLGGCHMLPPCTEVVPVRLDVDPAWKQLLWWTHAPHRTQTPPICEAQNTVFSSGLITLETEKHSFFSIAFFFTLVHFFKTARNLRNSGKNYEAT